MTKPRVKKFEDPNLWIYEHVLKNGVKKQSGRIMKEDLNKKAAEKLREIIEASKQFDRELKEINYKTEACLGLPHRTPKIDVNTLPFSPLKPRSNLVLWKEILPRGDASARSRLGLPFGGKMGVNLGANFGDTFSGILGANLDVRFGGAGGTSPCPQKDPMKENASPKSEERREAPKSTIFSKLRKTKKDEICKATSFFNDHMSYYDTHLKEKYMNLFLNSLEESNKSVKRENMDTPIVCQTGDNASVGVITPSVTNELNCSEKRVERHPIDFTQAEGAKLGTDSEEYLCSNVTPLEKVKCRDSFLEAHPNGEVKTGYPSFKGPPKGGTREAPLGKEAAYDGDMCADPDLRWDLQQGDTDKYGSGNILAEAAEETTYLAGHFESGAKKADVNLSIPLRDTPKGKTTLSADKSQCRGETPREETDRNNRRNKTKEGNSSTRTLKKLNSLDIFEKMNSTSLYGGVGSQGEEDSISSILQKLRERKKNLPMMGSNFFSASEGVATVERGIHVDDQHGVIPPSLRTILEGGDASALDKGRSQVKWTDSTEKNKGQYQPKGKESILQYEHLDSNNITVHALSQHVGIEEEKIINVSKFILDNEHITKYTKLEKEVAELICEELAVLDKLKYSHVNLKKRNPVVTILGHVDHGKTTLLDRFRNSNMAQNEIGGITQKLGAFEVVDKETNRKITFLDTPGHSVFKKIRQRCAQCTDLIILVISLDDGIMSETVECIQLAKRFNIPLIIAANKIDKFGSDLEKISKSLVAYDVITEMEENGHVPIVPISAKENINIDKLRKCILQLSDSLNLMCDYGSLCSAYVLEKKIHPSRGKLLTLVCKSGTLKINSYLLIGHMYTKVKQIYNCNNQLVRKAYPSEVIQIVSPISLAQDSAINYGDLVFEMSNLRSAQRVAKYKSKVAQYSLMSSYYGEVDQISGRIGRDEVGRVGAAGGVKSLPKLPQIQLIIKAGDEGSIEAILEGIAQYSRKGKKEKYCDINNFVDRNYVKMNNITDDMVEDGKIFDTWEPFRVVSKGVGSFNMNDLKHCNDVKPIFLIAFNVDIEKKVQLSIEENGAILRTHNIIYKLFEDLEKICNFYFDSLHLYEPVSRMVVSKTGFYTLKKNKSKKKRVLSVSIKEGSCNVNHYFTVLRNKQVIHKRLSVLSMQKNKDNTTELGKDCAINSIIFNTLSEDFEVGDEIVAYRKVPRAPLFSRVKNFDLAV
ncbi:translation initiation factor IF-2 [Plasmodium inui San Antonio 1]|uniref:Translation initiation factor IF-2 n=1 Tax=Plasmodium inui San Antonio 1 TaxID=1237626 RepID=W7A1M1_9APIC|nr:translation initiation factor IF-2 [Plasmodium inui San Antonio 1]EUD67097.1 translation initiation factor IF-2 [Plasmodium inui San Antonio 1]